MNIRRFDKATAPKGHNDTILAGDFLPAGVKAPFGAAYGYLENGHAMESHAHPTEEIYVVLQGRGTVHVGKETAGVAPGDVVEIPADAPHTMSCQDNGPLLWAALWWARKTD
jgi:mannose-6-phosphate isomerase-like protein (cupin superfamily)